MCNPVPDYLMAASSKQRELWPWLRGPLQLGHIADVQLKRKITWHVIVVTGAKLDFRNKHTNDYLLTSQALSHFIDPEGLLGNQ